MWGKELMGLGKKQQWCNTGQTQRQEALPYRSTTSYTMVGRDMWASKLLSVSFLPAPTSHFYITVEMMLICSSKNVVACRAGLKKVAICFQQKLWGCLDLASCSTRWVIPSQNPSGLHLLPPLLQCLPQRGRFLKCTDWEKFPGLLGLSYRSHLCCASLLRVQRPPVFLSWHSPLRGVREAIQMSL